MTLTPDCLGSLVVGFSACDSTQGVWHIGPAVGFADFPTVIINTPTRKVSWAAHLCRLATPDEELAYGRKLREPTGASVQIKDWANALERCIANAEAWAERIDQANPGDPWASLIVRDDITLLRELHASLGAQPAPPWRLISDVIVKQDGEFKLLRAGTVVVTDGAALPPDDEPHLSQCNHCGRKSWDAGQTGEPCRMPQPSGLRCGGLMASAAGVQPSQKSQQREVMQLALDALEKSADNFPANTQHRLAINSLRAELGVEWQAARGVRPTHPDLVTVPREPTPEMLRAVAFDLCGTDESFKHNKAWALACAADHWRSMIAAASGVQPTAALLTDDQRQALRQTLDYLRDQEGKSHQGYFYSGWAGEQLRAALGGDAPRTIEFTQHDGSTPVKAAVLAHGVKGERNA